LSVRALPNSNLVQREAAASQGKIMQKSEEKGNGKTALGLI
jgi:hypothetical protein